MENLKVFDLTKESLRNLKQKDDVLILSKIGQGSINRMQAVKVTCKGKDIRKAMASKKRISTANALELAKAGDVTGLVYQDIQRDVKGKWIFGKNVVSNTYFIM